jgi:glycosyltransferase involved in cell wall biosynthesis
MSKPRIIHVIHSSAFGGGPNMLAILCLRLAREFDMEVICDGQGDVPARLEAAGTKVHRLPLTTKWSFTAQITRLAARIRELKPDLVQLHGQFAGSLGQLAVQLAGRPKSLYTVQWPSYLDDAGPWSRLRNQSAELVSCRLATAIVTVSENDRRTFVERSLAKLGKITVIHNAYSIEIDQMLEPSRPEGNVVGFVGRLADQKGVEYLIQAAPQVLAKHPNVTFVIVGDGPERVRLEQLSIDLHVSQSVDFAGYQPEPSQLIQSMAVVVIPSIYDPFPLVTLEVMALGRPIVGSAVGGIPEAVEDGCTGLLVPPRDPTAIAKALIRLFDQPQLKLEMGAAGRARAKQEFSPGVITGQYADLYRRLLSKTSS